MTDCKKHCNLRNKKQAVHKIFNHEERDAIM